MREARCRTSTDEKWTCSLALIKSTPRGTKKSRSSANASCSAASCSGRVASIGARAEASHEPPACGEPAFALRTLALPRRCGRLLTRRLDFDTLTANFIK